MFPRAQFAKFVIPGLMAMVVAGGLFLSTEQSFLLSLHDSGNTARVEPRPPTLASVEAPLANSPSEPGCECQGECGFAEQMRQSEH
jgi:hypothetical protein